jgi:hypothetical protein
MRRATVPVLVVATLLASACGAASTPRRQRGPGPTAGSPSASPPAQPSPTERPVPAENNPPGDIPDTTVFVPFRADGGRILFRVPEGWARRGSPSSLLFSDKLNSISVEWFKASAPPTPSSVKTNEVPQLRKTERAFRLHRIVSCDPSCSIPYSTAPIDVRLAGSAEVLTYGSNSRPNAVTGRQYRLEVLRFDFYRRGEEAVLTLSGPVGSDNVDPWRLVSESFRWT